MCKKQFNLLCTIWYSEKFPVTSIKTRKLDRILLCLPIRASSHGSAPDIQREEKPGLGILFSLSFPPHSSPAFHCPYPSPHLPFSSSYSAYYSLPSAYTPRRPASSSSPSPHSAKADHQTQVHRSHSRHHRTPPPPPPSPSSPHSSLAPWASDSLSASHP